VGIGGVLEPVQAGPVIIEDNCFIGARSEVVEGVIVEENAVLSMGVYIGRAPRSTTARAARSLRPRPGRLGGGAGQPALGRRRTACTAR
jgi:2,3,4,5-tetrahydropyridine-2,6-dicarboxylate N-succinyltransferase